MDCLFCKIVEGSVPSDKGYEDDRCLAFRDIDPQAPVHLLFIPKAHIEGADDVTEGNADVVAHIFTVINKVTREQGLTGGYRVVSNCGEDAQQSVRHLHFHVLGGRALGWPPG